MGRIVACRARCKQAQCGARSYRNGPSVCVASAFERRVPGIRVAMLDGRSWPGREHAIRLLSASRDVDSCTIVHFG
jgi:hypothetical protein